ncbi:MAG: hypothetical protein KBE04_10920, partial [Phycisphaerae bacterium]|nr:hypothetical protein [Phycisphaerae bacterium]
MQARPDEQLTTLALRVRCVGRWLVAIEAVQALAWVLVPVSGVVVVCWALGCCTRLAPAVRVAVALLWLAG